MMNTSHSLALAAGGAVSMMAGQASAQIASATIQLGDLFAELESNNPNQDPNFATIDLASLGLTEDIVAYRVTTDWEQVSPLGGAGTYSVDAGVLFIDDATLPFGVGQVVSQASTSFNAIFGPASVSGLGFVGTIDPLFNSLGAVDFIYTTTVFGEFGTANFNNTQVELYAASGISSDTFESGVPAANQPTQFIDLGSFGTPNIDIFTGGGDIGEGILYGADGTFISILNSPDDSLVFGDGELIVDRDRTGDIFYDGGLGEGEYFFAVGGSLLANNGFSVDAAGGAAGTYSGDINGRPFEVSLDADNFAWIRFQVVPSPSGTALVAVLGFGAAVRRRR